MRRKRKGRRRKEEGKHFDDKLSQIVISIVIVTVSAMYIIGHIRNLSTLEI